MDRTSSESGRDHAVDGGAAGDTAAQPPRTSRLPSELLFRGRRVVEIEHEGEVYRLQSTRLGKLILTK